MWRNIEVDRLVGRERRKESRGWEGKRLREGKGGGGERGRKIENKRKRGGQSARERGKRIQGI